MFITTLLSPSSPAAAATPQNHHLHTAATIVQPHQRGAARGDGEGTGVRVGWLSVHSRKMDNPNITMEEYIQLMSDKARRGDFETDFPAIVFNDVSTSNQNVSSEPTISIYNAIKSDTDFHISFSNFEDEDYAFIYNKDSSSYKLVPINDLKPKPGSIWRIDFLRGPEFTWEREDHFPMK
ncbi:hypothetical protein Tco_0144818 [Tanacetum coccineum]